ncbi:MAG: histidine kinase [Ignavibacteriota bacterium]
MRGIDRDRRIDELYHTSWTLKDGAPSEIFSIAQTVDGYLWLGTTTGLVRFDGLRFENYESSSGQKLPGRNVGALLAIPDGGLVAGFSTGDVSILRNGQIASYGAQDGLPASAVRSLVRDRRGRIWAASVTGLSQFDGSHWRSIGADWNFSGGATAALVDRAGTLWIGTPDRVVFLTEGTEKFQRAADGLKYVTSLAQSLDGDVWMSQLRGPTQPVLPLRAGTPHPGLAANSNKIVFDDQGSLWLVTFGYGLFRMPYPDRLASSSVAEPNSLIEHYVQAQGLTSEYTETVFQDREGDMWVGTGSGLDRFQQSTAVPVPFPSPQPYMSLAAGDRGTVWVSPQNRSVMLVRDRHVSDAMPQEFAPIHLRKFNGIYRDASGVLWMATDRGIVRYEGRRFMEFPYPRSVGDPDRNGAAATMTEGRAGSLWVSILGDAIYRLADGNWTRLDALGGPKGVAISSFTDPDGHVWLGFLDKSVVRVGEGDVRVLSSNDGVQVGKIRCIQGRDGNVWIGGDDGLARFDGSAFRPLIPAGGRGLRDVFGVVETEEGLWLSENRGIVHVPRSELLAFEKDPGHRVNFRVFGFLDGVSAPLQRSSANPALVQSSDGLLWFATTQGLVFVDPKRIARNSVPPPLTVTAILANARSFLPSPGLALPERTRNLEIDYTGISLAMPERVKYRYKLEGADTDWQDVGVRRQAFYTNPGPGSYRFRVRAVNADGVWNDAGAAIDFSIVPAFYETWWFRLMGVLAAGGMMWLLYRLRMRLVTAQIQARLGERVLERERIARELHDTLLQSLAGISLQLDGVSKQVANAPEKAVALIRHVREQMDSCFREARIKVWNLRSPTLESQGLPSALAEFVERVSPASPARCDFAVSGVPRPCRPEIEEDLLRIAQEAVNNAMRHASADQIRVELAYGERSLSLRVSDNGHGFDLEEGYRKSGHWGLKGMQERAAQIRGTCTIKTTVGQGTDIEIGVSHLS